MPPATRPKHRTKSLERLLDALDPGRERHPQASEQPHHQRQLYQELQQAAEESAPAGDQQQAVQHRPAGRAVEQEEATNQRGDD